MSAPSPAPTAPPALDGKEELYALRALLNKSIDAILDSQAELPSLDACDPFPLAMTAHIGTALAASNQIIALLEGPTAVGRLALSFHVPTCLRAAIEAHAAEAIRENGHPEKGLHVDEIAKASNINPQKLGKHDTSEPSTRVLRLLAAHHVFRETSEDTFANNRLSIGLDTGKQISDLKGNNSFHSGTLGIQALLCHLTDEGLKGSAFLSDHLQDPSTASSDAPNETAWSTAFQTDLDSFGWFNPPGNEHRLERFGWAMKGVQVLMPSAEFDVGQGFDWAKLAEGAKVVDVGGGVGSVSLALARACPKLNGILQDRQEVIEGEATALWAKEEPTAVKEGRVVLQAHDFFTPQPVKGAAVYLLRFIVHDWSDRLALDILRHVRSAASASSRLVLVEQLVRPLCATDKLATVDVPGVSPAEEETQPAWPLLPSGGSTMAYLTDLQMLAGLNAQERTLAQFAKLGEESGWKLEKVHRAEGGAAGLNQLVFSPV